MCSIEPWDGNGFSRRQPDYLAFENIMRDALARQPTRMLSYCVMPNHRYMLFWLRQYGERIYLSMPLPPSSALPPSPDAFKVSTAPAQRGAMVPVKRRTHSSIAVPSTQTPVMENGIDIPGEAEGLRDGLLKVAAHAGKILRFLRSVSTQQRIVDFARTSLLALGHQVTHGGKE